MLYLIFENERDTNSLCITNVGFQFLLQDTYTQIWTLLLAYIRTIEIRDPNMNKKEVLSFLFQLSFLTFGKVILKRKKSTKKS